MVLTRKLFSTKRLLQNIRQFHCSYTRSKAAYEGSGKTRVDIINLEPGPRILIDTCTESGFKFVDRKVLFGPVIVFPKTILCWDVASGNDINEESLSLLTHLEPKLDIVILGLETTYDRNRIQEMKNVLIKRHIPVEVLPVIQACGLYNILCDEGRFVAAALIPPSRKDTILYKSFERDTNKLKVKE